MAMFSGIGRGLTSMGLGMERNRIRSEDLSQREAEREDARAYNRTLMKDQEDRRVAALAEARTYGTEQEEARRTWETEQEDARRVWQTDEADRVAGLRAAQAATAATTAAGVVDARVAREEELRARGVEGWQNIMQARPGGPEPAGEWKGIPYPSTAVWDTPTAADAAAMHDAGYTVETPRTLVQPPIGLMQAIQDRDTPDTAYDAQGRLVGARPDPVLAWREAQDIVNQGYAPPPQTQTTFPQLDLYSPPRAPLPEPLDQSGRSPAPRRDAGGGASPGITPDMLDMFDRQGWSLEQIDAWLDARGMTRPPVQRRGRGGR